MNNTCSNNKYMFSFQVKICAALKNRMHNKMLLKNVQLKTLIKKINNFTEFSLPCSDIHILLSF